MTVHFLKTRRTSLAEDASAPVTVTLHGFALGPNVVAWHMVSEIRAWSCDRLTSEEAFIAFTFGRCCVVVSEQRAGFEALEAAMIATFPSTARWRQAVKAPPYESNEAVLFQRTR